MKPQLLSCASCPAEARTVCSVSWCHRFRVQNNRRGMAVLPHNRTWPEGHSRVRHEVLPPSCQASASASGDSIFVPWLAWFRRDGHMVHQWFPWTLLPPALLFINLLIHSNTTKGFLRKKFPTGWLPHLGFCKDFSLFLLCYFLNFIFKIFIGV